MCIERERERGGGGGGGGGGEGGAEGSGVRGDENGTSSHFISALSVGVLN